MEKEPASAFDADQASGRSWGAGGDHGCPL